MGVFYTESPASRQLCIKSGSQDFELLVLNTSIIRPASNRFIRIYLERLHGGCYEPLHESLRDVLSETFGVMVYQEDVVNVSAAFAGMPLATGDGLRKALSKKRPVKALAAYAEEFFAGAAALGRDPVVAQQVWHMVMSFAGYSFCKGHSCSYIQVAQQSAYLRAHYPAEFFAAVLSNGGGFYAPFAYVAEARRAGITMLPPDVNASDFRTTGTGATIQIGFQFIKGLSADAVDRILGARTAAQADARDHSVNGARNRVATGRVSERPDELDADAYPRTAAPEGNSVQAPERAEVLAFGLAPGREPFTSLDDFRNRTKLRPDDLRVLIKVGALDAIARGMTRPMLLWEVDKAAGRRERSAADQTHLHAVQSVSHPAVLPEYSAERRRREELSLLGFSTDCHPMDLQQDRLRRFRLVPASALPEYIGQHVLCCGMLTTAKPVHTAKDEPMQFATFDDGHGLIETVLFPDVHRSRGHILFDQGPFIFRGKVEAEFGAVTVTVTHLDRIERMLAKLTVPGKHS
jgi:DNA polymerase III alpha subunit